MRVSAQESDQIGIAELTAPVTKSGPAADRSCRHAFSVPTREEHDRRERERAEREPEQDERRRREPAAHADLDEHERRAPDRCEREQHQQVPAGHG